MKNKKNQVAQTDLERFCEFALEMGAKSAKQISADTIVTAPWARFRCQYGCAMYGKVLSCPPFSPKLKETQAILKCFSTAILVEGELFKVTPLIVAVEREIFLAGYYKALGMGEGPCMKCKPCRLNEGCCFPKELRPAMEACGIDVFQTLLNNGISIEVVKNRDGKHRHFGVVLVQ